ncbi:MAG: tyrosine-type recombinase/integrase [Bacteroidota bacterium]
MATNKKIFVPSEVFLYDAEGDLSKRWFVWFYDSDLRRIKLYKGINVHHEPSARYEAAYSLMEKIKKQTDHPLVDYLQKFLNYRKQVVRASTFKIYSGQINRFIQFYKGQRMTVRECSRFTDQLFEAGVKANTIVQYVSLLRSGWEWMQQRGMVQHNPWKQIEIKRTKAVAATPFQQSHINHLKATFEKEHPQMWLFIQFIYYCFIRPGELVQLKVGDVLLESNQIRIPASVAKNRKAETITIPTPFQPTIKALYTGANPNHYLIGKRVQGPGKIGYDSNSVRAFHQKILHQLGYDPKYKLYSWKHTGAIMAVKAGISLKQLQIQLRHASLDQTDQYLRAMGVNDLEDLQKRFPAL